ncbi:hypothetical protein RJT34_03327 [Clitoria ternatea]|uniref:Uncharacterized protein n=1 Tax=Clitoria ternatea TaxID=43366 RepID=A0AAN9KMS3_CLITE
MLVSLEALAMAGASYVESGMDVEEWENTDFEQNPPPHLMSEECYKEQYLTLTNDQDRNGKTNNKRAPECMGAIVTLCMIIIDICRKGFKSLWINNLRYCIFMANKNGT